MGHYSAVWHDIAARPVTGILVAKFGSSAAGTTYLDTVGAFFRDETVFAHVEKVLKQISPSLRICKWVRRW